jgi:methylenetetrahydrofolate dehydrogenase (NADP+) / methenyltetrahydrofolate cyclohydrolase
MRLLDGSELAGYIKERQAKQVRNLRQSWKVLPKLAIVQTIDSPVIDTYVRLKQRYGEDILVDVEVQKIPQGELLATIERLNGDESVHGIIIQLPLENPDETDQAVNMVAPEKDVDGLGERAAFDPATPTAIDWLLAGYNVNLIGKKIAVVGHGRLVGAPLAQMWQDQGKDVTVIDKDTELGPEGFRRFDVIITAVGQPNLISSNDIAIGAVVVDAATSSENGKLVGDVAEDARQRDDLTITPIKGGVGPLTVAALFDNVITAARRTVEEN